MTFARRALAVFLHLKGRSQGRLTQGELAEVVAGRFGESVGQEAISRWLRGAGEPESLVKIAALAGAFTALGEELGIPDPTVDPGWLAFGTGSAAPAPSYWDVIAPPDLADQPKPRRRRPLR